MTDNKTPTPKPTLADRAKVCEDKAANTKGVTSWLNKQAAKMYRFAAK